MLVEISSIVSGRVSHSRLLTYHRWLRFLFRFLAIALAGLHTLAAASQHSMNADGIAYLDIGDAYFRGDWDAAINPVWSPLYSWILGLVMRLFSPPMRWEFPTVHLVNFAIYLAALASFEFFWRQLMHWVKTTQSEREITLPEWAWMALGYLLFIWSSLVLIEIWAVTPDMLLAVLVYLAAGLVLRVRLGNSRWDTFILLGLVLGFGYLAKAAMLPIAMVFLVASLFSAEDFRRALPYALAALCAFLLISGPYVALISIAERQLTFGEAGRLTYLRHVNGIPYPHWQGDEPGFGFPAHPTRRIFDRPAIYEFGSPIAGTYPVSYNPAYWYEGAVPRLNLEQQARVLLVNALFYFDLFLRQQGGLFVGTLALYLIRAKVYKNGIESRTWAEFWRGWSLGIIALAALGMYAVVLAEGRYVAAFLILLWADLPAGIRLPARQSFHVLTAALSGAMVIFLFANLAIFNLQGYVDLTGNGNPSPVSHNQAPPPAWPGEVAEALHRSGVQQGDKVAMIGYGFDAFWARLARVKIVAEMFAWEADDFWLGDSKFQSRVLQAFASTEAKAVVAENVPSYAPLTGWHRVGDSNYYIYLLNE